MRSIEAPLLTPTGRTSTLLLPCSGGQHPRRGSAPEAAGQATRRGLWLGAKRGPHGAGSYGSTLAKTGARWCQRLAGRDGLARLPSGWQRACLVQAHAPHTPCPSDLLTCRSHPHYRHHTPPARGTCPCRPHPYNVDRRVGDGPREQVLQQVARLDAAKLDVCRQGGGAGGPRPAFLTVPSSLKARQQALWRPSGGPFLPASCFLRLPPAPRTLPGRPPAPAPLRPRARESPAPPPPRLPCTQRQPSWGEPLPCTHTYPPHPQPHPHTCSSTPARCPAAPQTSAACARKNTQTPAARSPSSRRCPRP